MTATNSSCPISFSNFDVISAAHLISLEFLVVFRTFAYLVILGLLGLGNLLEYK